MRKRNYLILALGVFTFLILFVLLFYYIKKGLSNSGSISSNDSTLNEESYSVFSDLSSPTFTYEDREEKIRIRSRGSLIEIDNIYDERSGLQDKDGFMTYYGVNVMSTGDIYTETLVDEGKDIGEVFVMKAMSTESLPVDVVVGIRLFEADTPFSNWWLSTAISGNSRLNIKDFRLDEEYLESMFESGSEWTYIFYFDSNLNVPEIYKVIANLVYGGRTPENVFSVLDKGDFSTTKLFPYQIYEKK